jgi:acyl carrier protein
MANTPTEDFRQILRDVWVEALKLDEIDPNDSFFGHGGDSLGALNVVDEVEMQTGIVLSLTDFAYQSFDQIVRSYAERISETKKLR